MSKDNAGGWPGCSVRSNEMNDEYSLTRVGLNWFVLGACTLIMSEVWPAWIAEQGERVSFFTYMFFNVLFAVITIAILIAFAANIKYTNAALVVNGAPTWAVGGLWLTSLAGGGCFGIIYTFFVDNPTAMYSDIVLQSALYGILGLSSAGFLFFLVQVIRGIRDNN